MNQNTSVDNDLQKAIDDITKTTNGDPLFTDPVAAPAMPPAPTNVGPFPAGPAPMPAPAAQIPSPNFAPEPSRMPNPATINTPTPEMAIPEPTYPEPAALAEPAPLAYAAAEQEVEYEAPKSDNLPFEREGNVNMKDVKEAALRELAPLLTKLDVPAEQKFNIYKNVIDNYHDVSVIASAYRAASEIEDERTRGEALLYIINSIDSLN